MGKGFTQHAPGCAAIYLDSSVEFMQGLALNDPARQRAPLPFALVENLPAVYAAGSYSCKICQSRLHHISVLQ
jgi:hypothetical protein